MDVEILEPPRSSVVVTGGKFMIVCDESVEVGKTAIQGGLHPNVGVGVSKIDGSM